MIRFNYTSDDLYEVFSRIRSKSNFCRSTEIALLGAGPVAFFLWMKSWCSLYLMVPFAVVSVILAVARFWPRCGQLLNRAVTVVLMIDRTGKLPRNGKAEISLETSGIRWTSTYRSRFTAWEQVRRICEDADYVFVQVSFNTYHWIPKRAFANADDCTRFLARCRELAA